jgi:hypothetical protein
MPFKENDYDYYICSKLKRDEINMFLENDKITSKLFEDNFKSYRKRSFL